MSIKIKIFEAGTKKLVGKDILDGNSFDWHEKNLCSFDFIPEDTENFVLGKFLTEDIKEKSEKDDTVEFYINKYKLLQRNKDPKKQFDDELNSKWKEFEVKAEACK